MSDHAITVTWEDGYPSYTFTCNAPLGSICQAVWDCACEAWDSQGVEDGTPWHGRDDGEWRHLGSFLSDYCGLRDWFENSDECLVGTVTMPVVTEFRGDFYLFRIGGAA